MEERDIRQLIEERLEGIEGVIPFDTFSDLSGLCLTYNIDPEVFRSLLQNILKEKNITVGPQGATRGNQWPGSEKAHDFSSNKPGQLYEPLHKDAFKKGDWVKLKPTTWRSEVEGIILTVNKDGTVNIGEPETKNVYENVPTDELDIPLAKGRPVAPPQYKRRMNDVDWWGPSDIGDPNYKREYPGIWMLPKGQEGQSVVNPINPFYKSAAAMYETTIAVTSRKVDWDEIKSIAEQVRGQFIEDYKVSPRGFCEKTSRYLANVLRNELLLDAVPIFGYVSDIKGRMLAHWWVEVEDKIIDVTGDQFGKDADLHAVYVGPLPDNYIEAVPYV